MRGPQVLIVIDGFGLAPDGEGNAVTRANTPVFDRLYAECPWSTLAASGLDVGLPAGVMGNSEVGHLNIGAGRIVPQDIVRIDAAISSGAFVDNTVFRGVVESARRRGGRLHLMGLYSDGRVHSSDQHVRALLDLAAAGLPPEQVLVHVFTDGRDTPPRSAEGYVAELAAYAAGKATLATVCGRYYAMDRDRRWERLEQAWAAVVAGEGRTAPDAVEAVRRAYARDEGDEFIRPTVLDSVRTGTDRGTAPLIRPGDAVLFWNFRADRARQMCSALVDPAFDGFPRRGLFDPELALSLASMTHYDEAQTWPAAFPPLTLADLLPDVWAERELRQLRIAETEKYAHVTYFFSGGREAVLAGEERILVPSPKVATYDLQPEMSVPAVTERLLGELRAERFDAVALNFAGPDMVGHTGVLSATVRAVEVVDECVGRLVDEVRGRDGLVAITADHGNAEQMLDPETGGPHTAHTLNPVPLLVCGAPAGTALEPQGRLCDVAPTLLELAGFRQPEAMTGRSLLR